MILSPEDLDQAMATVVDLGNSKDQLTLYVMLLNFRFLNFRPKP